MAFAQNDSMGIYQRFPTIPPFKIISLPDSSIFTEAKLVKNKPVMFFLFSPDCDHCKQAFTDMINNFSLYDEVQIIMTSSIRFDILKQFYEDYHISKYPNIIMGRDPSSFLNTFFEIKSYPGIFTYGKKGKLQGEVRQHPDFKIIADLF